MTCSLTILSSPPGATVYINNVNVGVTPINDRIMQYGTYNIEIRKTGYVTYINPHYVIYLISLKQLLSVTLPLADGFLEITGVTAPASAYEGDLVNFTVHTKNTGASDDFRVELSGGIVSSQEFFLGAGLTKDIPFSFAMPNNNISITINTYHFVPDPSSDNYPGAVNDDSSIGTQAWSNPNYAAGKDNYYATVNLNAVISAPIDYSVRLVKGGVIVGHNYAQNNYLLWMEKDRTYGGYNDLWGQTWTAEDINAYNFGFVFSVYGFDYNKYSHYLKASAFNFNIPVGSIIKGIEAVVTVFQNVNIAQDVQVNQMRMRIYYTEAPAPPTPPPIDFTPRIAYWSGKVNQHTENGVWMTDPDGTSGANIDKLTYCQKWYPYTVSFREYKMETITTWMDGAGGGPYTSTKQSYEAVQG